MLNSNLCNYSDTYIFVKGTITITGEGADYDVKGISKRNKEVKFKNSAPFTDSLIEINDTQADNTKDLDTVMPISNLIEKSDNYLKTSGSLWQYYRDESANAKVNS